MHEPVFFENPEALRTWFEAHHARATELLAGYYKVGTGRPSITWSESVDEALCVGWIDGIRRSLGPDSYTIRFTPRNPKSIWSAVNLKKMETLLAAGRVLPEGKAAYEKRDDSRSRIYSFEQEPLVFNPAFEAIFKENAAAWAYFNKRPPSYRKGAIWWVTSAKQEATQQKRLQELIRDSEAEMHVKHLRRV